MTVTALPSNLVPARIATAYAFASVITPVDGSIVANGPYQAFYCGASGDVTVTPRNSLTTVTFKRVPVGTTIPFAIQGIQSTGTAGGAGDYVGLG